MSKIICLLENASDLINGIKFGPEEGVEGLVSEEVSESVAALFLSIPGYVLHGAEGEEDGDTIDAEQTPAAPAPKPETAAQRKARLKAEQEAADKAAAEEAARKAAEEEAAKKAAEEPAENADAGNGEGNNEVF